LSVSTAKLKPESKVIRKFRAKSEGIANFGLYVVVDLTVNAVCMGIKDLTKYALEIGALKQYEEVA